jgi:hypothetical protein
MTTNYINHIQSVSHTEAMRLIMADYHNGAMTTWFLMGAPGVGKTQLGHNLAAATDMPLAFINVPTTQPESMGIPVPNHDTGTVRLYPDEIWGLHTGKPLILFLDEMTKGPMPVQNILHTALEHPRRIGNTLLPDGSIVIATGNLPSVGVGDVMRPHTRNRVCILHFRSPSATEWVTWGTGADINPYVLALADQNNSLFLSFSDPEFQALDATDPVRQSVFNPDPSNPNKNEPYVSPRSLEAASRIVWNWERSQGTQFAMTLGDLTSALQGTVGMYATEKLKAIIRMGNDVPAPVEIMNAADNGTLATMHRPDMQPAQMMMVLNAPHWLSGTAGGLPKPQTRVEVQGRITAWFKYMEGGFTVPVQTAFVDNIYNAGNNPVNKGGKIHKLWEVMVNNPEFQRWATAHSYVC